MDFQKKDSANKRESAGFISKLFFLWIFPLFWKGRKKSIDIEDLDSVPQANKSEGLCGLLQEAWDTECANNAKEKRPNLFKTFIRTFGRRYFAYVGVFAVDGWIVRIAQPLFLKFFIRSFHDPTVTTEWQCIYGLGVCLSTFFHIILNHPTGFQMCVSGMRCRVAVSSLIYRKALRLSRAAEGKNSVGQIVNILSNDVSRFDYNLHFIAFLFVGPVQLFIFFYFLWEELGIACLAGVGYVLLLSPSQFLVGKLSAMFRVEIGKQTDERSRVMNEIIMAMRLIKMYSWQKPFSALIDKIRQLEVKALKKRSYLRASYMGIFTSNFTFVPFLTILTYGLLGNSVTPDKAFFAVAIFNVMTEVMMYYVPNAAASVGELKASVRRIEDFLLLEEQGQSKGLKHTTTINDGQESVKLENVNCKWDGTNGKALDNISLDVKGDKLIMVVGPVGSGKSSLLQCILSELPIESGTCSIKGKISYSSQEAWIFPGTVRQNILLGQEFVKQKYSKVLEVCALEDDLKQWRHGDGTIVGERGVSLSGGQKARINLARALYQGADVYLFDDPLSAVDAKVSRHIFEKAIQSELKGKLRILVTHQLQYLPQCDHVVVFEEGKIIAQGTYDSLVSEGIDFVHLLTKDEAADGKTKDKKSKEDPTEIVPENLKPEPENEDDDQAIANREAMVEGAVSWRTYLSYFKSGDSLCLISFLITAFVFNQFIISCTDFWLSIWTSVEEAKEIPRFKREFDIDAGTNDTADTFSAEAPTVWNLREWEDRNLYMYCYIGLALLVFFVDTTRTFYFFAYTMRISSNIHAKMFNSVVQAPIRFFDMNPSGRIMNRFFKDVGTLDEFLPLSMFDTLDIGLRTVGCMTIILILNYYLIVPAIILLCSYSFIRMVYIKTSRNVKRVETCTRSPLYTHLASSVQGLTTIRCFRAQKALINQFDCSQDIHSSSWYHFLAGNNWFSIWLEICSTIFIAVVVYSFVLFSDKSNTLVGQVGLAVASLLQLMNTFQFGMRQSAEMENFMTSVERALEYTKIDPEVSKLKKNSSEKMPKSWPSKGAVSFSKVTLSYDEGTDVLKEVSFVIRPQENVGIVGRTGAGKSSIIAALFRMSEISSGEIKIDGCDIAGVSLNKLRKNLSIIPQDPILFSGSIRKNLDPFSKFKDEELWRVLADVELKDLVPALDYEVLEGGKNFSVGQRQLICLARAILRNNKIIVMDEATANVDLRTDHLIQQTIRKKFSACTIITIAHRLQSVMDSDKILVLDNGIVQEYDHPHNLLQNEEGALSRMVSETGPSTQVHLRKIAHDAMKERST